MGESAQPARPKEAELIRLVVDGHTHYYHDLIRPYERKVFQLLRLMLRNEADAEDASQETFLRAYRNLAKLRDASRFGAWLMQIAANAARVRLRDQKKNHHEPLEGNDDSDSEAPRQFADWSDLPSEVFEKKEFRLAVAAAIESLPPHYREVIVLADVEGMSAAEICEILGLTVDTVKMRLHRARMRVQEKLRPVFQPRLTDHLRRLKGMSPWSRAGK